MPRPKAHSTEEYIKLVKDVHGDVYDYSKVVYTSLNSRVIVICRKHGEFELLASTLLKPSSGCMKCKHDTMNIPREELIRRFTEKFGRHLDYSLLPENTSFRDVVQIRCMHHGLFSQEIRVHNASKHGCPRCSNAARSKSLHETPRRAKKRPEPVSQSTPVKIDVPKSTLTWKPTK